VDNCRAAERKDGDVLAETEKAPPWPAPKIDDDCRLDRLAA